jgi:hypothetical protein
MSNDNMTEDQLRDELDKWGDVQYRMKNEGIEYCFRHYSNFIELENEEFHLKREKLIDLMEEMEEYVKQKFKEVEYQIDKLDNEKHTFNTDR